MSNRQKQVSSGKCVLTLSLLLAGKPALLLADRWSELHSVTDQRFARSQIIKKGIFLPVSVAVVGGMRSQSDSGIHLGTISRIPIQTAGIRIQVVADSSQEKRVVRYAEFGAKLGAVVGAVAGGGLGFSAVAVFGPAGVVGVLAGLFVGAAVGNVVGGFVGHLVGVVSNLVTK